jgi:hypothetical protein
MAASAVRYAAAFASASRDEQDVAFHQNAMSGALAYRTFFRLTGIS